MTAKAFKTSTGLEEGVRVLYCDLDGTIRKGFDELGKFVNKAEDVELFEGVAEKLKIYKDAGWRIVGITNQGGVSLGHLSFKDMKESILETDKQCGLIFDKILACIHHPEAKDLEFAICWCRKPRIGLIVEAAIAMGREYDEFYPPHLALFVGDRDEDRECAKNAGIKFMDAKEWRNEDTLASLAQDEER